MSDVAKQVTATAIISKITGALIGIGIMLWDFSLYLLNFVAPKRQPGFVIPQNAAGHGRKWPEYVPPKEGDSRSACPMLNALANHGILPHDGKNIPFRELTTKVRETFNFAPTFCFFATKHASDFLHRSYWTDKFDLEELSKHNEIEHDGSLTRRDVIHAPDQGKPDLELVDALLKEASGKTADGSTQLTKQDLIRALAKRRLHAQSTNNQYTETNIHRFFGSANSSTMLTIFDGRVKDLTPMLTEERFSEDWEPRVYGWFGLPMASFNLLTLSVEKGVTAATKSSKKVE